MPLDVRPVLYAPGKILNFEIHPDWSDLEFAGRFPVTRPVTVSGIVSNHAGALTLEFNISTILDAQCDRCGKIFPLEKEISDFCVLAEEVQDENQDEIVLIQDGQADIETLARDAFILSMDTKILCRPDCKGLCPKCGADLNLGSCGCPDVEPDPRWAVLSSLLE